MLPPPPRLHSSHGTPTSQLPYTTQRQWEVLPSWLSRQWNFLVTPQRDFFTLSSRQAGNLQQIHSPSAPLLPHEPPRASLPPLQAQASQHCWNSRQALATGPPSPPPTSPSPTESPNQTAQASFLPFPTTCSLLRLSNFIQTHTPRPSPSHRLWHSVPVSEECHAPPDPAASLEPPLSGLACPPHPSPPHHLKLCFLRPLGLLPFPFKPPRHEGPPATRSLPLAEALFLSSQFS